MGDIKEDLWQVVRNLLKYQPGQPLHLLAVVLLIELLLPLLLRLKRGGKFDTRPLMIVFHGFMFGVYGIGLIIFYLFLGGITAPFACHVKIPLDLFENVLPSVVLLIFFLTCLDTVGLIVARLGGGLTRRELAEHLVSLSAMYYMAPYSLDERLAVYYGLEVVMHTMESAKHVMENTSKEVRAELDGQVQVLRRAYNWSRLVQALLLLGHSAYQLHYPCAMSKQLASMQLIYGVLKLAVVLVFTRLTPATPAAVRAERPKQQ